MYIYRFTTIVTTQKRKRKERVARRQDCVIQVLYILRDHQGPSNRAAAAAAVVRAAALTAIVAGGAGCDSTLIVSQCSRPRHRWLAATRPKFRRLPSPVLNPPTQPAHPPFRPLRSRFEPTTLTADDYFAAHAFHRPKFSNSIPFGTHSVRSHTHTAVAY